MGTCQLKISILRKNLIWKMVSYAKWNRASCYSRSKELLSVEIIYHAQYNYFTLCRPTLENQTSELEKWLLWQEQDTTSEFKKITIQFTDIIKLI